MRAIFLALAFFGLAGRAAADGRLGFANAARDASAGQAEIQRLRGELAKRAEATPLGAGPARSALEAPIDAWATPDAIALARARDLLGGAKEAFATFEHDTALDRLRQADVLLRAANPSPPVTLALADANLLAGLVHAARGEPLRALEAFRLVRRLAPERTALDPGAYRPQLVKLYAAAAVPPPGAKAALSISTDPLGAAVWIDGRAAGAAPVEKVDVSPGDHYVGASLDGHAPRIEKITVGGPTRVSLLLPRLVAEDRARAIRADLLRADVEHDWARSAAALADVASVEILVVVRDGPDATLEGAVYDARADRLGPWIRLADAAELAATLPRRAPRGLALPGLPGSGLPPATPAPPRWYGTWWGQATLIGSGLLALGTVLALTAPEGDNTYRIDNGWTFGPR